jgi:hypothetical protein
MSLLSTDIAKVKRLSLRDVKLPTIERKVEPITPILVERPPTDEEIAYSKLVAINPLLEELVERLDLVSTITGERIKKVELTEANRDPLKPLKTPAEAEAKREEKKPGSPRKGQKIEDLIKDIIGLQSHRTKVELTTKLMEDINITEDRAETEIALEVPKMLEYTSIKEYNLRQGEFKLFNTNKLLWWFEGTDGFKTGWTDEAKYCLTSTVKRDDLRLIAVVMASPVAQSHFRDSMQLFNYGFAKYSFKSFFAPGSTCGTVRVGKGAQDQVEVVAGENAGVICAKGEEKKISYKKSLSDYIDAPVKAGQKLGELMIYQDQELLKKVNLNAAQDIERGGLLRQFLKMIAETYLL